MLRIFLTTFNELLILKKLSECAVSVPHQNDTKKDEQKNVDQQYS